MRRMRISIWKCIAPLSLFASHIKLWNLLTKPPLLRALLRAWQSTFPEADLYLNGDAQVECHALRDAQVECYALRDAQVECHALRRVRNDGFGAVFPLKLIALILYAVWLSPACASGEEVVVKFNRVVITDCTELKVYELGVSLSQEGAILYGDPGSKRYSAWYKFALTAGPNHVVINELHRINHKAEVVEDVLTIFRDCAYICSDVNKCKEFIDTEIDLLITKLIFAKVLLLQDPKPMAYSIKGNICIYGLDNPDEREQVITYWRIQEIQKLGRVFKASMCFNTRL